MYDSTTLGDIPTTAAMVAGYVDGKYANMPAIRQRWPHAVHVGITVLGGSLDAQVVDCEQGDTTPSSAAAWAKRKIAAKQHPTIYCSESMWPAVRAAVRAAGIPTNAVSYWIAHYDNMGREQDIPAGAVAKQFRSTSKPNLDTSVVRDYWPGVDPVPVKKTTPTKMPPRPPAKPAGPSAHEQHVAHQTAVARAIANAIKAHAAHLAHLLHIRRR